MKIIPIFIPHAGCPYRCIYCDQHKISGALKIPSGKEIRSRIDRNLKTIQKHERIEIGFLGGTFTLLPEALQKKYLEAAYPYVKNKKIQGLRMSTHPEAVTEKSIKLFKKMGGCLVELGVQSLDKEVLKKCGRVMDFDTIKTASRIIKNQGLDLGVQVMLGLSGDTLQKSVKTAKRLLELKPKTGRIYPAIVLKGTGLAGLFRTKKYKPLSMKNAIEWSAKVSDVFEKGSVKVIRIGLHPSEELNSKGTVLAGPYHPNFGEMARSRQMRNRIMNILGDKKIPNRKAIEIHAPKNLFNLISGYKGAERKYLENYYGAPIRLRESPYGDSRSRIKVKIKDLRKDIAVIDPGMPFMAKKRLNQMGYYVAEAPLHKKLAKPVSGHPDMMMFSFGKKVIYEPCMENMVGARHAVPLLLIDNGYECIKGENIRSGSYPDDIIYDVCNIGKHIIRYEGEIERNIKKLKAKFIRVKQGYAKCSIIPIDERHIITSDKGIYYAWNAGARHAVTLHIRPGYIKLPGYKTGFIGGASGVHKERVFFIGSLKHHPDGQLIRNFIEKKGKVVVELYEGELYDAGTIFFFEASTSQSLRA